MVLQGEDYEARVDRMEQMTEKIYANRKNGKVIIASGMAEFNPESDSSVADVFERADSLMYKTKTR